jgi:hypothetical protein
MLLRFSAHTVAGQWRILTALPITRWKEVIDESEKEVKRFGNWVNGNLVNEKPIPWTVYPWR